MGWRFFVSEVPLYQNSNNRFFYRSPACWFHLVLSFSLALSLVPSHPRSLSPSFSHTTHPSKGLEVLSHVKA